ncbi:MAG: TraR/DksA family transcriptional regulator [Candidatus Omnitrophica bacterium]|nr:TraR/DksA family transcriptional regulator [Candidatus Omnitrophota bacterium]
MPNKKEPGKVLTQLNKKELETYEKELLKLKEDIVHDIKNMHDNTRSGDNESKDLSGHVMHMADVATDMYDKEFNLGLASKDRELLQEIEDALQRIKEGTFGVCIATGKHITKARLKAIPYVKYCLDYQEQLDSKKR